MTAPLPKQMPLGLRGARKTDVRTQFAAVCYRIKASRVEILLITSRRTRRWIVPKGWPVRGKSPSESALHEAWEEAGVVGRVNPRPIGIYSYVKLLGQDAGLPCVAMVYAVKVKELARDYPERAERRRKWVSRKKAGAMVDEPELARILREFDPKALR
ncbi:MAG: NUDIX hydrolase [Pseudomonadota bacterium]